MVGFWEFECLALSLRECLDVCFVFGFSFFCFFGFGFFLFFGLLDLKRRKYIPKRRIKNERVIWGEKNLYNISRFLQLDLGGFVSFPLDLGGGAPQSGRPWGG